MLVVAPANVGDQWKTELTNWGVLEGAWHIKAGSSVGRGCGGSTLVSPLCFWMVVVVAVVNFRYAKDKQQAIRAIRIGTVEVLVMSYTALLK